MSLAARRSISLFRKLFASLLLPRETVIPKVVVVCHSPPGNSPVSAMSLPQDITGFSKCSFFIFFPRKRKHSQSYHTDMSLFHISRCLAEELPPNSTAMIQNHTISGIIWLRTARAGVKLDIVEQNHARLFIVKDSPGPRRARPVTKQRRCRESVSR